jgi:hypothetical protein
VRITAALLTVVLAAGIVVPPAAGAEDPGATWVGPLSTRGRYIVDANGNRFKLKAGNWHGASGTWWHRLVTAPSRTGQVPASDHWSMLNLDYADFQESRAVRAMADRNPGARKGACPDGQRVIGLSHTGNRGLCTGSWTRPSGYAVVRDESYVDNDWASGYTKAQCPPDYFLAGYSATGAAFSAALCGKSATPLGRDGRTVWFDRGDNRPAGNPGGEFASGDYNGQCAASEYIAGVAYTGRIGSRKTPDAILCRS